MREQGMRYHNMAEVERAGSGLVLVLANNRGDEDVLRILNDQPEPDIESSGDNRQSRELRSYGIGAQIIADLGVRKMQVISAPWKLTGLAGFGLEISGYLETDYEDESP